VSDEEKAAVTKAEQKVRAELALPQSERAYVDGTASARTFHTVQTER